MHQLLLQDVRTAIQLRLPKTPITSLTCKGFGGLCEVVSEKTLFYIDERKRAIFLSGVLYDMESRADLTAAKLLELNPQLLVAGTWKRKWQRAGCRKANEEQARSSKVSLLIELTPSGAIHWGPKSGPKPNRLFRFSLQLLQAFDRRAQKGAHTRRRAADIHLWRKKQETG